MEIELLPSEATIATWTIVYQNMEGSYFNGKLTVTNKRLLYDAGSEGYIEIHKNNIVKVETEKSLFSKKAILTLQDGSKHIFNYGTLNIDKMVNAIQS